MTFEQYKKCTLFPLYFISSPVELSMICSAVQEFLTSVSLTMYFTYSGNLRKVKLFIGLFNI
jgi:hypothetical protein